MSKLAILTPKEQKIFDNPPVFNSETRAKVFNLTSYEYGLIDCVLKPTNQIFFILQLVYFKQSGRFFTHQQFKTKDIEYVANIMKLNIFDINIHEYNRQTLLNHQRKILTYLGWSKLNTVTKQILYRGIESHASQQKQPKDILYLAENFLINNKIVVPSYCSICEYIGDAYNSQENKYIKIMKALMTKEHEKLLDKLIDTNNDKRLSAISYIQNLDHSEKTNTINDSVKTYEMLKSLHENFKRIHAKLNLSHEAIKFHAIWVEKSKLFQLKQFDNKYKTYLYLISYISHKLHERTDFMVEFLIKSVRSILNRVMKATDIKAMKDYKTNASLIAKLSVAKNNSDEVLAQIHTVLNQNSLNDSKKITSIKSLVETHGKSTNLLSNDEEKLVKIRSDPGIRDKYFYQSLSEYSIKLQRKITKIVKCIDLVTETGSSLPKPLNYFVSNTDINDEAPIDFLTKKEMLYVYNKNKLNVSLYKALLFVAISTELKSGKIYARYSYSFAPIDSYLISRNVWEKEKHIICKYSVLNKFKEFKKVIVDLKDAHKLRLEMVNNNYSAGNNVHLKMKDEKIILKTPKTNFSEAEHISALFAKNDHIPIVKILSDIDKLANFTSSFSHHSVKNSKMRPAKETIFAGLIGKGCNIGINRMANISTGISENVLRNTVNWFFNLENIQHATNKIISLLNKLQLPSIYKADRYKMHTSSDGQKMCVSVNSIHANYSYKYYGKDQGVSIYSFIDERNILFYDTIISPTEREAAYVIDGLMANKIIESDIHSTDTHGFTEVIFALTHLLGISFAPRIKKINKQQIYGFHTQGQYKKMNLDIVIPNKKINLDKIECSWDNVLRLAATILQRKSTASQILKRLNSYAQDNPLYNAIKEFGRLPKSIYIFTYYDDLMLRQRIEKQLNKIEQANKFTKAIFFANNQEFKESTQEEQRITIACKTLIHNCIMAWNYLYLSQIILDTKAGKKRQDILKMIKSGSAMCWKHINFHGEFDFTRYKYEETKFDLN